MRSVMLVLAVLVVWWTPVRAQTERVLDFSAVVAVRADGALQVTETITVQATGDQIKRGIVREFPTTYTSSAGRTVKVGFELGDVLRDGQPEPHHVENRSNGVAIYAGQKDVFLPPGRHVYRLTYTTTRQLGFFEDHDELYWNVNGNGWRLPMDRVACTVTLPPGATASGGWLYEGPQGGTDGRAMSGGGDSMTFVSSRPYAPGEGLTIVVSWPKGFVAEPPAPTLAETMVEEGGGLAVVGAGAAVLLVYYLLAWLKVGRDPARGVIIPLFAPPKNFSPAMVRMLWRMKFDNAAFGAAIVDMAVKKALRITENGKMRLELAGTAPASLSLGERAVWDELRKGGTSIELKSANHRIVGRSRQALKDRLNRELASHYFLANSGWVVPGVLITLATVGGMAWAAPMPPAILFICVWLTGWTFGCFTLLRRVHAAWQSRAVMGKVGAVFLSLFSLPFLGGELAGLGFLASQAGVAATAVFLAMILVNALFYELLKAPTHVGRQVLDQIEGFRMYLSVAEKDRLGFLHPPDETPELFEKFLPYAMALDVENEWGERFAGILNRAGYEPSWYAGRHWNGLHPGSFVSSLSGGMQSAVSSASTAPGSSSGMGGGGSSGGGGGGGGGGGW
jgi:uncharacterized membrane protein YgcG